MVRVVRCVRTFSDKTRTTYVTTIWVTGVIQSRVTAYAAIHTAGAFRIQKTSASTTAIMGRLLWLWEAPNSKVHTKNGDGVPR